MDRSPEQRAVVRPERDVCTCPPVCPLEGGKDYVAVSDLPDNTSCSQSPALVGPQDPTPPINVNVNVEVDSNFDSNQFMQEVKQQISEAMDKVMESQRQALEFQRQCLRSDQQMLRELQEVTNPMICSAPEGESNQFRETTAPKQLAIPAMSQSPSPGQDNVVTATNAPLVDY